MKTEFEAELDELRTRVAEMEDDIQCAHDAIGGAIGHNVNLDGFIAPSVNLILDELLDAQSRLSWEVARADQAERERDEAKRDLVSSRLAVAKEQNKLISALETCERERDWLAARLRVYQTNRHS